jgi:putative ABC transport system ATP-binding protein
MSEVIVDASSIEFRRAGRDILRNVSLAVHRGESVALMGPSGSGKTALLTLIAGLERPDAGTLTVDADPTDVGLVLQGHGLVGLLTVEENVAMPLLAPGRPPIPPREVADRVRRALTEVDLQSFSTKLVEALSGGQQQRVSIARALVIRPALLLADEPSAALDAGTRERVMRALLQLQRSGTTIVIATHDDSVARALDRRVDLEEGRITT